MIKYRTEKVIDAQDWDDLVIETYDKSYSFQQQEGCQSRGNVHITIPEEWDNDVDMNDSVPEEINGEEMGVKFDVWLKRDTKEWNGDKEDERFLHLFWERNFYPDLQTLANDLYKRGEIEAGDYTINIDW
jgi:hypothetical protein